MKKEEYVKKIGKWDGAKIHLSCALIGTFVIEIIFSIVSVFLKDVPIMLITNIVTIPIVSIALLCFYFNEREVTYIKYR